MVRVAVIGAGVWGKNLVRTFANLPNCTLAWCCDTDESRLATQATAHPGLRTTNSVEELLADASLEAVVVATPATTHHDVARRVLEARKHVFVEKPLSTTVEDARDLVERAHGSGLKLMVGHLLLHHPAVERMRLLVDNGSVGRIHYVYSQRVNLGQVRKDENALWSLAPHDISLMLHFLDGEPEVVWAHGDAFLRPGVEDVVFLTVRFSSGQTGHAHLSWLDPHKERKFTVVGERQMLVFDDVHPTEKLRVYDKGVDRRRDFSTYEEFLTLRNGDTHILQTGGDEPLRRECLDFVHAVTEDRPPRTTGRDGLRVVEVLDAAHRSLEAGGVPVRIDGLRRSGRARVATETH
ncbi:MAG: Gfo/Idh/MocA family oxidoreductase [Planctomycetes bacterium]|nr:Gfo/Idh/MocA family oxidoreductase [Planctomycetota bacterium]